MVKQAKGQFVHIMQVLVPRIGAQVAARIFVVIGQAETVYHLVVDEVGARIAAGLGGYPDARVGQHAVLV